MVSRSIQVALRCMLLAFTLSLCACTGFFFYPWNKLVRTPADVGVAYERIELSAPGQPKLVGWFLPAKGAARGSILFLHGNAENISTHLAAVHWLPEQGYQVFIFDYQGYGESEGSPSLPNAISDAERAVSYLQSRPDVLHQRFFLFGQSLGASLALYLAAQPQYANTFTAIIADSPFSSYRQIAREKVASVWVGYLLQWPLGFLVNNDYSPDKVITSIHAPILFLHGTNDNVVPAQHSADLCAKVQANCERWLVPDATHGEILAMPEYRKKLVHYLDTVQR
ncbi:MAG: alpha/beta hydrolase [Deltaproteobacteria bacterium]|nr:alpha/beta hydrolase [Deltaproteobacteria bacterium]